MATSNDRPQSPRKAIYEQVHHLFIRTTLERQNAELRADLSRAEEKLGAMHRASASRWKEFESDVNAAVTRLKKSIEKTTV